VPFSLRLVVAVVLTLGLAGCGKTGSYRYKLTLAVNTPDGIKRGSSVVEALFQEVKIPERGVMHKIRGEALYLDLGPGRRPLIALLTSQLHPKDRRTRSWSRDAGPDDNLLSRLYDVKLSKGLLEYVSQIARMRGASTISLADLPDLVTFADVNDPRSVIEVDPGNLQEALGANISWNEITLESTDEPVTKGIEQKLTWLPGYFQKNLRLDGSKYGDKRELANVLSWFDFDQSADLKRSN